LNLCPAKIIVFFFFFTHFKFDESHFNKQAESIRRSAGHYLEVIIKKILDTFPKAIAMYILEDLKEFLKITLFRELNAPEKLVRIF
jgi:hypothetical protein